MFAWLSRLFPGPMFDRILDSYALNRADLIPAIHRGIHFQQSQGATVWLVAHFADQIFELQNRLIEAGIENRILSEPIESDQLFRISIQSPKTVHLALAELLVPTERKRLERDRHTTIAIISAERHPLLVKEQGLERFVRQIHCKTRFGYYLSLEDPAIRPFLGETTLKILEHLGMQQGDLIHSLAVTKAIERGLKRMGSRFDPMVRADSAEAWLAMQRENQNRDD